jgi:hypothetical protein
MPVMLASVARAALRRPDDPLNVVLLRTDDEFDARLCKACPAHRFWAFALPGEPGWDGRRVTTPDNLVLLTRARGDGQLSLDVVFDLVVAPFRDAPLAAARGLSASLHLPLVSLFVDPPQPGLSAGRLAHARSRAGHVRAARGMAEAAAWGFARDEVVVVPNWEPVKLGRLVEGAADGGPYRMNWGFGG